MIGNKQQNQELPVLSVPEADRAINSGIFDKTYSAAACIASKRTTIYHRAVYGHPRFPPPHQKINFSAVFDLASLTKPLATGLACMYLCSQNRLDLTSPVSRILKDFKQNIWSDIKVEHLLDHTSGLPAFKSYWEVLKNKEDAHNARAKAGAAKLKLAGTKQGKQEIRQLIANESLEAEVGEQATYSDIGFMVLGFIVEAVTGRPLDIFCAQELYKQLEIPDLFFVDMTAPPNKMGPRRYYVATENCSWRNKLLQGEVHDPNAWAMGGVAGHAGLFGTIDSVYKLARILLSALEGENRLIHSGTLRRFWAKSKRVPHTTYGLAWDTPTPAGGSQAGRRISLQSVGHLGFTGCSLWIDYTKDIINVFLANAVHPTAENKPERMKEIRPRVHDYLFKAADVLPDEQEDDQARGAAAFGGYAAGGSAAFGNPLRKPGGL